MPVSNIIAAAKAPLAVTGRSWLDVEYKRKLTDYVWWKQIIFRVFLGFARFCDTHLELPTIIHHDKQGHFTIDYCGVFTSKVLALAAIDVMKSERSGSGRLSQFGWVDLPLNGINPEQSGRYGDADFVDSGTLSFQRANKVVHCPFNGSACTPDETVKRRAVTGIAMQSREVLEQARSLNRSQT